MTIPDPQRCRRCGHPKHAHLRSGPCSVVTNSGPPDARVDTPCDCPGHLS